jgi:hypothetical protein
LVETPNLEHRSAMSHLGTDFVELGHVVRGEDDVAPVVRCRDLVGERIELATGLTAASGKEVLRKKRAALPRAERARHHNRIANLAGTEPEGAGECRDCVVVRRVFAQLDAPHSLAFGERRHRKLDAKILRAAE